MRRDPVVPAAALLLFVVLVGPARAGGGFTAVSFGSATVVLSAFALWIVLTRKIRIGALDVVAVSAFALFAAWAALSLSWTSSVPLSIVATEHALLPVAALAAAVAAARVAPAHVLTAVVFAVSLALACQGLIAGVDAPLGYSNALALLCVVGMLVTAGWALERRSMHALAAVPALVVFAVVIVQSESRGAWVTLVAAAAVAAGLRSSRPAAMTFGVLGIGASAITFLAVSESEQRSAYWGVTLREIAREPFLGSGAGTWSRVWLEHRHVDFTAQNAHSLYLEALSELGPVGLALLLAGLLVPLAAAIRARTRPHVRTITAAYAAILLHAAVDWSWQLSVVQVSGLVLGAAVLGLGHSGVDARASRRVHVRFAAPALVILIVVGSVVWAGGYVTSRAADNLRSANWEAALTDANRARRVEPWSSEPWRLLGEAQRALGRPEQARASFRRGLELDDTDVILWRLLAAVSSGAERRLALQRVSQLDPLGLESSRATG